MMVIATYFRQRFALRIFVPAIGLLTVLSCWAAGVTALESRSGLALLVMTLLVIQFRVWDDLEDRDHDRVAHPNRVLPKAPVAVFRNLRVVLVLTTISTMYLVRTILIPQSLLNPQASLFTVASSYAALVLIAHVAYRHARVHIADTTWRYTVLLKYPTFIAIVALALRKPHPVRLVLAMLITYFSACAYEAIHTRSSRTISTGATT